MSEPFLHCAPTLAPPWVLCHPKSWCHSPSSTAKPTRHSAAGYSIHPAVKTEWGPPTNGKGKGRGDTTWLGYSRVGTSSYHGASQPRGASGQWDPHLGASGWHRSPGLLWRQGERCQGSVRMVEHSLTPPWALTVLGVLLLWWGLQGADAPGDARYGGCVLQADPLCLCLMAGGRQNSHFLCRERGQCLCQGAGGHWGEGSVPMPRGWWALGRGT